MKIEVIKAYCSFVRAIGFFFALLFLSLPLSATEVTRSVSLEDRVRILEQQLSTANRMRAESQFEVNTLKNEIRSLRGLVEEQGYQLQQIVNRQRELYRDIENRMSQSTSNASAKEDSATAAVIQSPDVDPNSNDSSSATIVNDTDSSNSAISTQSEFVDDSEIRGIYDKIFPLVRSKRYDDAIAGYQQFIAKYPDSIFVANSRYWLAQIYSVQGRTGEAEREYLNVAQQYGKSAKAPDAWLKLGQLYEAKGQNDKALDAYNQVVTLYASSTAAQMAVSRLQSLKTSN